MVAAVEKHKDAKEAAEYKKKLEENSALAKQASFNDDAAKKAACEKIVILSDAASCVAGFEEQGKAFTASALEAGVRKMTVAEYSETL